MDEFVTDMHAFTRITEAEKGCLFFTAALDDAAAGRVLVAERWLDQESLTAHLHTQQTEVFVQKWMSRMKGDVQKYGASNERSLMD